LITALLCARLIAHYAADIEAYCASASSGLLKQQKWYQKVLLA